MRTTNSIAALALMLACGAVRAEAPGVSADRILIGQTAGFTGTVAGSVKEATSGATLYFDWVNSHGGVNGRKVELVSLDDAFDPKRSGANAKALIEDKGVFALFLCRGTPHAEAIMPVLAAHKVALVAPSTGAQLLHDPVNPYIYNVRAKYQVEAEKSVVQLTAMGLSRIAVIHVDDSFGKDALAGALKGFGLGAVKPVGVFSYDRTTLAVDGAVKSAVDAKPQAVILIGAGAPIAEIIAKLRKADRSLQLVTLSNNASSAFVASLGVEGHGVIVSQVFPNPKMTTTAIATEMQRLAKSSPGAVISHQAMEGFASAKVLVEGLKRAGKQPTRESFLKALDSLHDFDLGGLKVDFSPTDHTGTSYVELSMIGRNGEWVQN